MKKNEFVKAVADRTGLTQKDVNAAIDAISDVVLEVIAANDSVKLGDVCTFSGVHRDARTARNPQTGATIDVPARDGYPKAKFTKTAKE